MVKQSPCCSLFTCNSTQTPIDSRPLYPDNCICIIRKSCDRHRHARPTSFAVRMQLAMSTVVANSKNKSWKPILVMSSSPLIQHQLPSAAIPNLWIRAGNNTSRAAMAHENMWNLNMCIENMNLFAYNHYLERYTRYIDDLTQSVHSKMEYALDSIVCIMPTHPVIVLTRWLLHSIALFMLK